MIFQKNKTLYLKKEKLKLPKILLLNEKESLGYLGEICVYKWFLQQNFIFLKHSLYYPREGEIDLIFFDEQNNYLFLIEVKTKFHKNARIKSFGWDSLTFKQKLCYYRLYDLYYESWIEKWPFIKNTQPLFLIVSVDILNLDNVYLKLLLQADCME